MQFLFLPTQTTGGGFLTWCYWLLLIFWVLSNENSLACFLLHLCWGLTMSPSCWLSTALHIWLGSVPGCILYMYICSVKRYMKTSTHAVSLCRSPQHPWLSSQPRLRMSWVLNGGSYMAVYHGTNETLSYISFYFEKKHLSMWKAVFDHC